MSENSEKYPSHLLKVQGDVLRYLPYIHFNMILNRETQEISLFERQKNGILRLFCIKITKRCVDVFLQDRRCSCRIQTTVKLDPRGKRGSGTRTVRWHRSVKTPRVHLGLQAEEATLQTLFLTWSRTVSLRINRSSSLGRREEKTRCFPGLLS